MTHISVKKIKFWWNHSFIRLSLILIPYLSTRYYIVYCYLQEVQPEHTHVRSGIIIQLSEYSSPIINVD